MSKPDPRAIAAAWEIACHDQFHDFAKRTWGDHDPDDPLVFGDERGEGIADVIDRCYAKTLWTHERVVVACWECRGRGRAVRDFVDGLMAYYSYPCQECNATGLVRIVAKADEIPTVGGDDGAH